MDLNNLILIFFLIGFNLFFYKYFLLILSKYNAELLIDDQFKKPQAFHEFPTSIAGGAGIFLSLLIVHSYFIFFEEIFFNEFLLICTLFFLIGFIDDIKIDFERIRNNSLQKRPPKKLSIQHARERKFVANWEKDKPSKPLFEGIKTFDDYSLEELIDYIDWSPFFHAWELKGL